MRLRHSSHLLSLRSAMFALVVSVGTITNLCAQTVSADLYRELRWRMIGPHRGGRTKAATGVPGQPNVFYIGATNGGVWKSIDYGRIWTPIFDDQPTNSIGAIAVAPSAPDVVYVGSGEGLQRPDLSTGDGIYKSTDAGRTWTHLGLRDGQQIPQIAVDPRNPDRLFVAVLGHPYGPNAERGIYRSLDGGRTFQQVLYRDVNTGGVDVVLSPGNAQIVYAVMWEARQAPWENGAFTGPGSGLFKSTDGGTSWKALTQGLPTFADGLGRIGITVAPSDPNRLYATVEVKGNGYVYRSDDAGEHWTRTTSDTRMANRPSDFAEVKVDPRNPDIVYTASIVTWKSVDGGKTWRALRGAPGGDDYHRLWINPENPDIILDASDQGAVITVNGGQTWSSWYNQPTAQLYHVSTDNAFPYRVCGGQQESGSVCIQSRGDYGAITFREWSPVGAEEYGYVAADPLDPDIVYGGKLSRFDRRTRQVEQIAPKPFRSADYRVLRTAPVVFSPVNPRALYFASNTVWRTTTGGRSWTQISPDLTRRDSIVPPNVGTYSPLPQAAARHPGVVYALAPTYVTESVLWAGTDDGLIHVTTDGGKSWKEVTPPTLRARPWSKVSVIDASHFDPLTAYAAVNTFRIDDLRPHIFRTHDGGKTWREIVTGIDSGAIVNVVREDPKRRGLLFAGSETQVWFSIDDGEHWQSLRLNMPASSIRDLVVKDDDLVVGTHGRSIWILDDITPLRQVDSSTPTRNELLFRPQVATRWGWNLYTDTPLPPDEPAGQNPPDGAILNYWLRGASSQPVTLEILDALGHVIRRYASTDTAQPPADVGNVPAYWLRPTQVLSAAQGMHRFVWDLRHEPPPALTPSYPISAIVHDTPREPRGVRVMPGTYTMRLTANGQRLTQPLVVRMDPRVKTPRAALARQLAVSLQLSAAMRQTFDALRDVRALRARLAAEINRPGADSTVHLTLVAYDARLASIEGGEGGPPSAAGTASTLARLLGELTQLYSVVQGADATPTAQAEQAIAERLRALPPLITRWNEERGKAGVLPGRTDAPSAVPPPY
ncbi:MAG TPA: hypothetical protein VNB89_10460 [Gemmatimonadaceae bacterium]|nr:hypothetical protein [Gemmatimonadaceae bacterium]